MKQDNYDDLCMRALETSRAYIYKHGPYYCKTIYGLVPYYQRGLGTVGVTKGMVLLIDPIWFTTLKDEVTDADASDLDDRITAMQSAILIHESMHVLRGLHRLEALPDHYLANIAFDIAINDDLSGIIDPSTQKKIWPLPTFAVYSHTFGFPKGLTGEQYYELLDKDKERLTKKGLLDNAATSPGSGGGVHNDHSDNGEESVNPQPTKGKVSSGCCGSCANSPISKELEEKVDAEVGRDKADVQRIRKETIRDIREAVSYGRGTIPGSLKELLEQTSRRSTINWRHKCARIARRCVGRVMCGQMDFSMKRISKRSYTRGIVRPGMINRKVEVAIVEDSSGSMGREQLLECRVQTTGIFTQLGITDGWFLDADVQVASKPLRLSMRQIASQPVHGRGGTDFRPALKAVLELRPKPDIVFYMTDGDGVAPTKPPKGVEVVWCIVPSPNGRRPASWGHLVVVTDDQKLAEPYMED